MNIISSDSGTALQRVNADEIRPSGGYNIPELVRLIGERYGFGQKPTAETASTSGAKFMDGRLIFGNTKINIRELTFFNDAIGVTSYDTKSAEFVLDDLFAWARETINTRPLQTPFPKQFHSILVIELDPKIERLFDRFEKVRKLYSAMIASLYDFRGTIAPNRLAISRDQTESPAPSLLNLGDLQWAFERRLNVPYANNRFISGAPLKTEMHIELLNALEASAE